MSPSVYRLLELYIRIDETQCKRLLLTQFNRSNKYKYNMFYSHFQTLQAHLYFDTEFSNKLDN